MQVKIKKVHPDAVIPSYSKIGDAGLDLTAVSVTDTVGYLEYSTGLAFEIPEGYVGLIFPRSSISNKGLILANSVGVLDSNFRGEITFRFKYLNNKLASEVYKVGDRIGQIIIMPIPTVEFIEVDTLTETNRGAGGYGSSGN
jgi:dUTP pyrophosphatase